MKDFDLALGCQKAYIQPDFSEALNKKTIILKCTFKNASLLNIKEKFKKNDDFSALFEGNVSLLFDELNNILYDTVHTELVVYGGGVRFPFYKAYGKNVKLCASGVMTKKGDVDIKAQIFFSPEMATEFPEELRELLTEESKGWLSYYLHIEKGEDRPFLRLDSDRLRINFEQVETH